MVSFGQAPVLTSTRFLKQRPGLLCDGSHSPVTQRTNCPEDQDSLHVRQPVRFGQRAIANDLRFAKLKQQGYQPFIVDSPNDIPDLMDFLRDKAFHESSMPSTTTRDEDIQDFRTILAEGGFIYMIRKDGRIVGSATLKKDGNIRGVGVDKQHRRNKIATTMTQGLIAEAKRRQLPSVWLVAETDQAETLYRKLGFKKTDRYTDLNGKHYPKMTLHLTKEKATHGGSLSGKSWVRWFWDGLQTMMSWAIAPIKAFLAWLFPSFVSGSASSR